MSRDRDVVMQRLDLDSNNWNLYEEDDYEEDAEILHMSLSGQIFHAETRSGQRRGGFPGGVSHNLSTGWSL